MKKKKVNACVTALKSGTLVIIYSSLEKVQSHAYRLVVARYLNKKIKITSSFSSAM
jgi:hypothetical protein